MTEKKMIKKVWKNFTYSCPNPKCQNIDIDRIHNYCYKCGIKINWEKLEE